MLQATTVPVLRSMVIGGALLAAVTAGVLATSHKCERVTRRLSLHAPVNPKFVYITAWYRGDVLLRGPSGALQPLTLETRGTAFGCELAGHETLIPLDERSYAYDYRETVIACPEGIEAPIKTPRTGVVTVTLEPTE